MCCRFPGFLVRDLKEGIRTSPFYGGGGILDEADHLLLHVYRLGLESKCHFVDQRLDAFAVSRAT